MCSGEGGSDPERLHGLPDGVLLAEVAALVAQSHRLAARLTAAVRAADARGACEHDGLPTMAAWLRTHTGLRHDSAAALVRRGRALESLPATAAAFAAGTIGVDQVTAIAPIVAPAALAAAADAGVDVGEVEAALAAIAAGQPHIVLAQAVAGYRARLDPDGPEPDPVLHRSLCLLTHPDGTVTVRGELDAVGGEKVKAVLEPIAAVSRTAGDDRTPAQVRADALVQAADLLLAAGSVPVQRTRRPGIAAVLGLADLVDPAAGKTAATMGFGATISAARARWLACDSTVARIVMGPHGQPIDRGRDVRIVPAALRHLLDLRDKGCVFAGCDAPAHWCEAHHVIHWAFGGETTLDNTALLCERHHGKVHSGFTIERDTDGVWHTYRPDGTEIHPRHDHRQPTDEPAPAPVEVIPERSGTPDAGQIPTPEAAPALGEQAREPAGQTDRMEYLVPV
ncbi:DUF222 domain-containing protein [Blastococcus sp. SYSU D00695]